MRLLIIVLFLTAIESGFSGGLQSRNPVAPAYHPAAAESAIETIDLGNGVMLELRLVKPGFYVGKYEITQGQWLAVMGKPTPPDPLIYIEVPELGGAQKALESVSFTRANEFCKKVSSQSGKHLRLPTEQEWEFFAEGTRIEDAVCSLDSKVIHPSDVGTKGPNKFGLYDVRGNLSEMCSNGWHDYKPGRKREQLIVVSGKRDERPLVPLRGGCYGYNSKESMAVDSRMVAMSSKEATVKLGNGGYAFYGVSGGAGFRVVMDK